MNKLKLEMIKQTISKSQGELNLSKQNLSKDNILSLIQILSNIPTIHTLNLSGNDVEDSVARQISALTSIKSLDISNPTGQGITILGAASLSGSQSIQNLNMIGHNVGGKNAERFTAYFLNNPVLLDLKTSKFPVHLEEKLQAHLRKNNSLIPLTFLMGSHARQENTTPIKKDFFEHKLFDRNLIGMIFKLLN